MIRDASILVCHNFVHSLLPTGKDIKAIEYPRTILLYTMLDALHEYVRACVRACVRARVYTSWIIVLYVNVIQSIVEHELAAFNTFDKITIHTNAWFTRCEL